jgi:hypothetical protein
MNATATLLRNLLLVIVGLAVVSACPAQARVASGPVIPGHAAASTPAPSPNLDAMVTEILERPLFSPSRQAASEAPDEAPAEEEKEPPKMPGRLAGVAVLPEVREALFERDGEKPIVVKEGQEIEGWTVASIRSDQVVLRNAQGEQIVKPADGAGIRRAAAARRSPAQVQAQARRPGPGKPAGPVIPAKAAPAAAGAAGPVRQPARTTAGAPPIQSLPPGRIGR